MFMRFLGATAALTLVANTAFAGDITIGFAPNLQTLPIVVAQSEGYFEEEGITLEAVKFTSGRRALEALIGGQLDVAFMAEYPVSIAALREQPFGTFTTLSRYTANRMISKASIGFKDPSSLEGKKIGTTMGSNTEFFTEAVLEQIARMSGDWAFVAVKTSYGIADEQNVDWKRLNGSRSAPTGKDYVLDNPQNRCAPGYMGRD